MADENNKVKIEFSASTDDALAGIALVRDGLTGLADPLRGLDENLTKVGTTFGAALPTAALAQAAKDFADLGNQAQRSLSPLQQINSQIKLLRSGLTEQKVVLNAEASQFQITQNQKFAMLEAETQKEYDAEYKLLQQEQALQGLKAKQYGDIQNKMTTLQAKHNLDMIKLDEQAIAQQQQMWSSALGSIESAFNSQLRGLLAGTTSWSKAFKSILGDLIIKFIEMCEEMVVKWAAAQLAQTTAATTGAAASTAAQQTASNAGIVSSAANAARTIMTDAGQAFAGVFAFLAPVMGPAAAGPAAAAQASVSAAAIFDVGTDYVVRGGLALIHPGETIIPAARGSGPYSGGGMAAQIHAPVSISVTALDQQSVARFFNDNQRQMMRAINDAVKRGAHLGLRAIHP